MEPHPIEKTQALLDDARLMLGYASRMGRLPNRNMLAVIERAEAAKPGDAGYAHAVTELLCVVNQLAQAIRPVTVADLGSKWTPFPQHRYDAVLRPFIALAATLLIFVLGYVTFDYTQARATAAALTELGDQDIAGVSAHLYAHWTQVKPNLPPTSVAQQDDASSYYHEMELVQRLQNRINQSTRLADSLSREPPVLFIGWTRALLTDQPRTSSQPIPTGLSVASLDMPVDKIVATYADRADYNQLAAAPAATDATPAETKTNYEIELATYLQAHGLDGLYSAQDSNMPALFAKGLTICNDMISIYGLWVLPALYGLFGALVYHLRTMMNPNVATPNLIAARWALAMMAGVSVSWVFSSLSSDRPGGITVFGLAFLFGYSVDVFFGALDRAVAQFSSWAPKPSNNGNG